MYKPNARLWPPLCTYRLNWARRMVKCEDTLIIMSLPQTQTSKLAFVNVTDGGPALRFDKQGDYLVVAEVVFFIILLKKTIFSRFDIFHHHVWQSFDSYFSGHCLALQHRLQLNGGWLSQGHCRPKSMKLHWKHSRQYNNYEKNEFIHVTIHVARNIA